MDAGREVAADHIDEAVEVALLNAELSGELVSRVLQNRRPGSGEAPRDRRAIDPVDAGQGREGQAVDFVQAQQRAGGGFEGRDGAVQGRAKLGAVLVLDGEQRGRIPAVDEIDKRVRRLQPAASATQGDAGAQGHQSQQGPQLAATGLVDQRRPPIGTRREQHAPHRLGDLVELLIGAAQARGTDSQLAKVVDLEASLGPHAAVGAGQGEGQLGTVEARELIEGIPSRLDALAEIAAQRRDRGGELAERKRGRRAQLTEGRAQLLDLGPTAGRCQRAGEGLERGSIDRRRRVGLRHAAIISARRAPSGPWLRPRGERALRLVRVWSWFIGVSPTERAPAANGEAHFETGEAQAEASEAQVAFGTACLDEAAILAVARGSLALGERSLAAALEHLDRCAGCRLSVAAAAAGTPQPQPEPQPAAAGETIGRFEIEAIAGRGAMGIVYRARDPRLDRRVALKLIRPGLLDSAVHARLEREARALAKVDHPAVVRVYEVGDVDAALFVAMELIDHSEILAAFRQAGEGLLAAHQAGLVHRDFKPSNAMIDGRGVHVTDFGLVAERDSELTGTLVSARPLAPGGLALTQTGMVLGTPAYMAPEQLKGAHVDPRADQFSFCVALFEALAGHRPFEAGAGPPPRTFQELLEAIDRGPVEPRRSIAKPIHRALRRGLARQARDRFESMRELLDALRLPSRVGRRLAVVATGLVALAAAGAPWLTSGRDWRPALPAVPTLELAEPPPAASELPNVNPARPQTLDPSSACAGIDDRWATIWSEARREALRTAELATWPEHPPDQVHPKLAERWEGVGRVNATMTLVVVDDFGEQWRSRYRQTCEDRFLSERDAGARLRRQCLDDVLVRADALLAEPPREQRFRDALARLDLRMGRCSAHLVKSLTWPEGELVAVAEQARRDLAEAESATVGQDHARALEHARAGLAAAERSQEVGLMAEAWLTLGAAAAEAGDAEAGLDALHEAIAHAQRGKHDRVFREAAELLAWTYLFGVDDSRQARLWLDTAGRLDGEVPPAPAELARRAVIEARLRRLDGQLNGARADLRALLSDALEPATAVTVLAELLTIADAQAEPHAPILAEFEQLFARSPQVLAAVAARRQP